MTMYKFSHEKEVLKGVDWILDSGEEFSNRDIYRKVMSHLAGISLELLCFSIDNAQFHHAGYYLKHVQGFCKSQKFDSTVLYEKV